MKAEKEKKWKQNIKKLGLEDAKDDVMKQAEDYEMVAEETQKLIKKFINEEGVIPPTVAFAMVQEITKVISTIATIEVLKDGTSRINHVLSHAIEENGGPMLDIPEDILNKVGGADNLKKAKEAQDPPQDVMFH